jgi:hypothetical protein
MMPECRNFAKCGNLGFIYIYGNFYCSACYKKFEEKMRIATEEKLIQE